MSRRKERIKSFRDVLSKRDEPDAGSPVQSETVSLRSEKSDETSLRAADGIAAQQGRMNTLIPIHLTAEQSGSNQVDSKSSVADVLMKLEEKINNVLEKAGSNDSDDREVSEVYAEMQKLLRATLKQKEDFNNLVDTVKRQTQALKKLEASHRNAKLGYHAIEVPEKKLVIATQCSQDCEELGTDIDQHIVLLILGRHAFHRKMSQCGSDYDLLNNVDIPDRINQGNRMLAGQQDYPHLLLDASAVDRFVDTESAFRDLSVNPELSDRMDVAGSDNAFSQCPVCSLRFSASGLPDHVNSHFGS